jgi:hypothetical protein
MKGKVSQQRYLMQQFEKNDDRLAEVRNRYETLLREWILDSSNSEGLSRGQHLELLNLASILNHYHPGQYEELLRPYTESDESDIG